MKFVCDLNRFEGKGRNLLCYSMFCFAFIMFMSKKQKSSLVLLQNITKLNHFAPKHYKFHVLSINMVFSWQGVPKHANWGSCV